MPGPRVASSNAAESRTVRLTQCSTASPLSSRSGPSVMRPWLGLSPTRPQQDAGMRIDPPPSLAWTKGTIPDATAAAAPPLDPPGVRVVSHGLWVAPHGLGGRHAAALRAVRAADDHQPGSTVAADECRVVVGDDVCLHERDVAVADPLPRVRGEEILDEERHAAEPAVGKIGACGGLAGVVEPADHDRVEGRIDTFYALDRSFQ